MTIVLFGLGSIGSRHARLLLRKFNHSLFAYRSDKDTLRNKLGIKELYSWKELKQISADVAFITNPTCLHIDTAIRCAKLGINLFIEKPIDCSTKRLEELLKLVKKNNLTTYVAYCMRFHPIIDRIRRYVFDKKAMHCRIVASSYLPDWRPDRDYQKVYSAEADKGGGAILDLSHEIDYSQYIFGDILSIDGRYGKISCLKINAEDYADIILKCNRGVVNLHLNFFSKNAERKITIDFRNSDYLEADIINNRLHITENAKCRSFMYKIDKDEIYLKQLSYFFKNFRNKRMMNNLIDASKLFKTIIAFKNER